MVRAGDSFVEAVQYLDPVGAAVPSDRRLSDQGMMNIALGVRRPAHFRTSCGALDAAGYRTSSPAVEYAGGRYYRAADETSLEVLLCPRELDPSVGFSPEAVFKAPSVWPVPTSPAYGE